LSTGKEIQIPLADLHKYSSGEVLLKNGILSEVVDDAYLRFIKL